MKIDETKLLILTVSIILGFLLSSQLSYLKPAVIQIPTLQDYESTMSQITRLKDEIKVLNEKRKLLDSKLKDYSSSSSLDEKVVEKLEKELENADLYACLTNVEGPGIIITLSDNTAKAAAARTLDEIAMYTVHDMDIFDLVWALKNAGAEAVSVNDQRIVQNSRIYCAGPPVLVDGIKMVPPYIIKAIGNTEALTKALESNDTYLYLRDTGFQLRLSKINLVTILGSEDY